MTMEFDADCPLSPGRKTGKRMTVGVALLTWMTLAGQAWADTACDPILTGVSYCSDMKQRQSGYGRAVYPDLIGGYILQDDPFVTSRVIAMPYAQPLAAPDDAVRMMIDQLMYQGSAPVADIPQVDLREVKLGNEWVERALFNGLHADGDIMARFVVEIIPRAEALLLIYTHVEGDSPSKAVDLVALEKLHMQSVANLEITAQ